MKVQLIAFLAVFFLLASCSRIPVLKRSQLNLLSESTLTQMADEQYDQVLAQSKVVTNTSESQMVNKVGQRLATATTTFLRDNGHEERVENYDWEFNLIDEDVANAWAMPGGKIAIYTGILPITRDETGLAVVMSHEIAHAIARHGNERMSQMMVAELGGMALQVALSERTEQTQNIFLTAYGVGAQLGVMLPYSRKHELEADKLGLIFMALADYNPQQAAFFWQRMAEQHGGGEPPEFLSTHPNSETRIQQINDYLPEAMKHYRQGAGTTKP